MKHILTSLLCLLVGVASATTMNWNATLVSFNGSKVGKTTDVVGYLIYLGGAGSTLSNSYALTADSTADSIISSIGTKVATQTGTTVASKLNNNYSFTLDTDYSNGDVFAMLISYAKDGKTYYNLTSAAVSMTGAIADPPTDAENANFSFSYSTAGESSSLSKGGGWTVAVPEPSTAMLALAGLALLIKRRRA